MVQLRVFRNSGSDARGQNGKYTQRSSVLIGNYLKYKVFT